MSGVVNSFDDIHDQLKFRPLSFLLKQRQNEKGKERKRGKREEESDVRKGREGR